MKTKNIVITLTVFLAIVITLIAFTKSAVRAEDEADVAALSAKVDEVLDNQKMILQGLASIKEELNIIKIRITQQQ